MAKTYPHYHVEGYINGTRFRSTELWGVFGLADAQEAKRHLKEYAQDLGFQWQSSGLCSFRLEDGELDMDNALSIEPCRWRDLSLMQSRRAKYLRMGTQPSFGHTVSLRIQAERIRQYENEDIELFA